MELGAHMLLCRLEGGEAEGSGDLSPRDERGIELRFYVGCAGYADAAHTLWARRCSNRQVDAKLLGTVALGPKVFGARDAVDFVEHC